jgi:hypothetical protein
MRDAERAERSGQPIGDGRSDFFVAGARGMAALFGACAFLLLALDGILALAGHAWGGWQLGLYAAGAGAGWLGAAWLAGAMRRDPRPQRSRE